MANKTQGNQSGERLLAVLEYMVSQDDSQKLMDIAEAMNMNKATLLRYLTTLTATGYVAQDEATARYYATLKICALANRMNTRDRFQRTLHPYLVRISDLMHESVCMAAMLGSRMVEYQDVVRAKEQSLMAVQSVGGTVPLYCNGIGKLFLANMSEEELDRYLKQNPLAAFTEHTITNPIQLKTELAQIRRQGYAYDNEEREIGARCVAFPLYDTTHRMQVGISVTGPKIRLTDEMIDSHLDEIRAIIREAKCELGYE